MDHLYFTSDRQFTELLQFLHIAPQLLFHVLTFGDILGKDGHSDDSAALVLNWIINMVKNHFIPNILKIGRITGMQNVVKMDFS